jgi:hypothetical protein
MIRPHAFGSNPETAASNAFQHEGDATASVRALEEFDTVISKLKKNDIAVMEVEDTGLPAKPDAVFPNNWFTTHQEGKIFLYPMMAPSRRLERRSDILQQLRERYMVYEVVDLSGKESEQQFLEGTGSIVFDHPHRIAYACESPRTHGDVLQTVCDKLNYKSILFHAADRHGSPIYHTNVMMWVGEKVACMCLDAIGNESEQEKMLASLNSTSHRIVSISFEQMEAFAGNMMEVQNRKGRRFLLLSQSAYDSLLPGQVTEFQKHLQLLPVSIPTIENAGGGSIRCMVAGIHLPLK